MVSKDTGKCVLTAAETEVEPAASLALEMKYALDPNRQIKKRNKALQVRFKDICEAQNEQRDTQLPAGQPAERREPKATVHRAAYRKYMTVPARRSIPNVTRSTGVQTSPDIKKCYQTFPLDRKKGPGKGLPAADPFKSHDNGFFGDAGDKGVEKAPGEPGPWGAVRVQTTALVSHSSEHMDEEDLPGGLNCTEPWQDPDAHSCPESLLQNATRPPSEDPEAPLPGRAKSSPGTPEAEGPAPARVFKTEVAAVYAPAPSAPEPTLSSSAAASEWSLCPADEDARQSLHLNGLRGSPGAALACLPPPQCPSPECSEQTQTPTGEAAQPCQTRAECHQIVPHTEVVDLKAQLRMMENLISSSQETIKVLLGVIQELERGEAHREGLSYRTGQDTANCDTCRNSACIIYSVELDFKQQEDKLQPVLRKLHSIEETQVAPSPYTQEMHSSTPKQKSKTESKKHGRWKLWFL
ncbi:PREDICTED: protein FAM196A [Elephantulus edwardii]|uniref:protein FAM196A n=1 Tax=Elephantulus edwardii TaxID=28737 RepID=UPI0003F07575|nr:PREDICTED: protein FAM196A [Elephantulus edwardii]